MKDINGFFKKESLTFAHKIGENKILFCFSDDGKHFDRISFENKENRDNVFEKILKEYAIYNFHYNCNDCIQSWVSNKKYENCKFCNSDNLLFGVNTEKKEYIFITKSTMEELL